MEKDILKIENNTITVKIGSVEISKKYSELATECLGASSVNGVTISEMKHRMRIIDQVEKSNGHIELEKVDFQVLKKCVSEMKWAFIAPGIVEFADAIESVK